MVRKTATFKLDPALVKRLKFLAVELDKTISSLVEEAIQDLLRKYGKEDQG